MPQDAILGYSISEMDYSRLGQPTQDPVLGNFHPFSASALQIKRIEKANFDKTDSQPSLRLNSEREVLTHPLQP
jgi:hypothetical protein